MRRFNLYLKDSQISKLLETGNASKFIRNQLDLTLMQEQNQENCTQNTKNEIAYKKTDSNSKIKRKITIIEEEF